jgi:TadE-like protein
MTHLEIDLGQLISRQSSVSKIGSTAILGCCTVVSNTADCFSRYFTTILSLIKGQPLRKKERRFFSKPVKLVRDEQGSALLEATLLTPIVLSLVLGVFEFAWYFYQQQAIEVGLRDAARYIARIAPSSDPTCSPGDWPTARYLATTGSVDTTNPSRRIRGWDPGQVNFTCLAVPNTGGYLGGDGTNIYVVQASTSFGAPSLGFLSYLGVGPRTIAISHQERTFGRFFP